MSVMQKVQKMALLFISVVAAAASVGQIESLQRDAAVAAVPIAKLRVRTHMLHALLNSTIPSSI